MSNEIKTKRQIETEAKAARAAARRGEKATRDAGRAANAARIAHEKEAREARMAAEEAAKPRPVAAIDKDAHAKAFYEFLGGGTRELRAIRPAVKKNDVRVAYYNNADDFASGVQEANKQGYNCYVNLNPFDPAEFPLHGLACGGAIGNGDVTRRHNILIDVDPERYEGGIPHPKGGKICTTDAEHDTALKIVEEIGKFFIAEGASQSSFVVNDSGNGAAIVLTVEMPNSDDSLKLVTKFLQALAQKFDQKFDPESGTPECHIDQGVCDAARITRIPGSLNCKQTTKERPRRPCHTISLMPSERVPVSLEFLNKIAGTAIEPKEEERDPSIEFSSLPEGERKEQLTLVVAYLDDNGIKHRGLTRNESKHFICVELPYCLVKGSEHQVPGRAGILVYDDGRISYHCFSQQCCEKGWAAVQASLKEKFVDFCARAFNKTGLKFDDPLRLAKEHLKLTSTANGTYTFAHFRNTTHRHVNGEWQQMERGENNAWVRDTIQSEYFRLAEFLSKAAGKAVEPMPVMTFLVNETYNTIESLCKYEIGKDVPAPFWLNQVEDWKADDVLVFKNGFLSVRKWLDNEDKPDIWFKPITPDLYYKYHANFDFPIDEPPYATEWFKFLDSLEQTDAWRRQLRQMMGYLLWSGYDLQKFFHLYGPTRAGKGIVEKVCEDLGGGTHTIKLKSFAKDFALENAVDKRLLVIGETEDGPEKKIMSDVVAAIKSITGGSNKSEINRKHVKNISVKLNCKLVTSGQKILRLVDSSGAVTARCIPFRYTITFLGRENLKLANDLIPEYPAILLWALGGLRDLYATHRFALCESTQRLLDEMNETNNPLQTFIEECCTIDSTKAVSKPSLYRIYENWFEIENDDSLELLNDCEFGKELPVIVPTVSSGRLNKDADTEYYDTHTKQTYEIVKVWCDAKGPKRPRIYTGIAPKEEWCKMHSNM